MRPVLGRHVQDLFKYPGAYICRAGTAFTKPALPRVEIDDLAARINAGRDNEMSAIAISAAVPP